MMVSLLSSRELHYPRSGAAVPTVLGYLLPGGLLGGHAVVAGQKPLELRDQVPDLGPGAETLFGLCCL